ncbi:MAG: cytochrome c-type biogenesis protein CcmH [Nitrososphaerales archaeon]
MRKITFLAVTLLLLLGMSMSSAAAQTPTPNQINVVAKDLWCPLCNGVRLDNCELQACVQMREVIGQKLAAGENKESIKAYFVQQYGDVVLGQPPREGFNLIAYIFPILAAVVGIGWVTYLVLTWRKRQTTLASAAAQGPARPTSGAPASIRKPGEDTDEYMKRVERELRETE